jgi:hydroxymethylpyrimidine/phosphomethylpyrimidine kinase
MMKPLPDTRPPLTLIFGAFDPTGAEGLPADAVTCAALGSHALGVLTGTNIADSSGLQQINPIIAEQIDEQARTLLEDMQIAAFKVGALFSPEAASVIAQIIADYSESPMVLHLGQSYMVAQSSGDPDEYDIMVGATLELLLPQTHIVVIDEARLKHWFNDDVVEHLEGATGPGELLTLGANWALVLNHVQRPGHLVHLLLGPESQTFSWPAGPKPHRMQDLSGLVATAVTVGLAQGLQPFEACEQACAYSAQSLDAAFQAGMGARVARRFIPFKTKQIPHNPKVPSSL